MNAKLIINKNKTAYFHMASDEYLLQTVNEPVLRLYTWKPEAVSIGRFQSVHDVVHMDTCAHDKVDVVRRMTGGGAVYHDKEITYSFVFPLARFPHMQDLHESYIKIEQAVIRTLYMNGIHAEHAGLNDIVVNGKKISGCAQTRKYSNVLQHGTLLLSVDIKKMFTYLIVSKEKMSDKIYKQASQRVTSMEKEIGHSVDIDDLAEHMVSGFARIFGLRFLENAFSPNEIHNIQKIENQKYRSNAWLYER
jgi:lipoate-protein ligase A